MPIMNSATKLCQQYTLAFKEVSSAKLIGKLLFKGKFFASTPEIPDDAHGITEDL